MSKLTVLVLAGFVFAASSYQMLATDSLADGTTGTPSHELDLVTRNAAFGAFTDAKRLVEAAGSPEAFRSPGRRLQGEVDGAYYRTHILAEDSTVAIRTTAFTKTGDERVEFAVYAEVAWANYPDSSSGYLILLSYGER